MEITLTRQQRKMRDRFREVADREIAPHADQFDKDENIPADFLKQLASKRLFGGLIPKQRGGCGWDMVTYGLFCEEIGRASASLLSMLTVHNMVSWAIMKWGSLDQQAYWLPKLAAGEIMGGFALTEPQFGSDAKNISTEAAVCEGGYQISGHKKWISCGQIANLFLVIARCEGAPSAFLMENACPGLTINPTFGMLGFRAAMLSELQLNGCRIPQENLLGKIGFGFSHVAGAALDLGRYSIAWGSVGLSQACVQASLHYTGERVQFGTPLKEHQLIQQMIANMIASTKASRLLCLNAGYLKDIHDPDSIMETAIAKYFASTASVKAALDAVQIHGANGCSGNYPVQRYLRDAKIMEIIEGSNQIQQLLIARNAYSHFPAMKRERIDNE